MLIHGSDTRHPARASLHFASLPLRGIAACCGLAFLALAIGCTGGDSANNSPGKPQFEVAEDEDTKPAAPQPGEVAQVPANPMPATPAEKPAKPAVQPPADPGPTLEDYKAPDGSIDELFTFMKNVDARVPQGNSQAERLTDMIQIQQAIMEAAEKVTTSPQATVEQKVEAAQRKIAAMATLDELEVEGAREKLTAYCQALVNDENPQLQEIGRLILLNRATVEVLENENADQAKLLAELKQVLNDLEANETVFMVTREVANQLDSAGFDDAARQAYEAVAVKFADHENPNIRNAVAGLRMQSKMGELGFNQKLRAVLEEQPDSMGPFMQVMQQLTSAEKPTGPLFEVSRQASQLLEMTGHYQEALQILQWADAALVKVDDPRLREETTEALATSKKRLALVGKPLPMEGLVALGGKPFDWSAYRGKIVLVDFWASWCGPCIAEFPEMKKQYAAYHDQGFEIVGINLDDTTAAGQDFLNQQPLPWQTVVSGDPGSLGFANPVAEYAGVEAIPFIVLLDEKGIVTDLHVRGPKLGMKLREKFGPAKGAPEAERLNEALQPEAGNPALEAGSSYRPAPRTYGPSFVSLLDEPTEQVPPAEQEAEAKPNLAVETIATERAEAEQAEKREFGEIQGIAIDNSINPYAPDPSLSKLELAQLLLDMRDKPKSIQRRPGFAEGILIACDRLIEVTEGEGRFYEIAVLEKLSTLHGLASFGDEQADAKLQEFVATLHDSEREKIAAEVAFLKIERRVIEVAESEEAQVDDLLTELKAFYAEQSLEEKHLRMASSTVKAINKIEDDEAREKHFEEFGKLFAASKNQELAKYGKRIGKAEVAESDLVGKPLELEGLTAAGLPLDWASYRGQPVIVDFWATWCGPCRREMPKLQQIYTEQRAAGLEVIGISLDQDQEALATYLQENNIAWQTLVGEEAQALATKYGVRGIPTMMLVDAEGNVAAVAHNVDALLPKLKELQAQAEEAGAKEAT